MRLQLIASEKYAHDTRNYMIRLGRIIVNDVQSKQLYIFFNHNKLFCNLLKGLIYFYTLLIYIWAHDVL